MKRLFAVMITLLFVCPVVYAAPSISASAKEVDKKADQKTELAGPKKADIPGPKIVNDLQSKAPGGVSALLPVKQEPQVSETGKTTSMKMTHKDPRIRHVVFDPNKVVLIDAYPGIATHIVFAKGETVVDHGTGFSKAWELVPNGQSGSGHYYLKPRALAGDTNLFITTNKREYSFDLILHKDWRKKITDKLPVISTMTYRVVFVYPQDEAEQLKKLSEEKYVKNQINNNPKPRNWNYTMHVNQGSEDMAPKMAYDDGRFTYLKFPNNREIPAIYQVWPDKSESIINHHVVDDMVVVQRVGREFILRIGEMAVGLFNDSFDPDGVAPANGITVEGLKRVIKSEDLTNE
jgi:type IV secretion system protein VirB9